MTKMHTRTRTLLNLHSDALLSLFHPHNISINGCTIDYFILSSVRFKYQWVVIPRKCYTTQEQEQEQQQQQQQQYCTGCTNDLFYLNLKERFIV